MPLFNSKRDSVTLPTCEGKRLTHPFQRLNHPGDVFQDWRPFLLYFLTASPSLFCLLTLVPHCFFLSLWFYERTCHPDYNKMDTFEKLVCHLLSQLAFLKEETEQALSWKQDSILGQTVDFEWYAQYQWKWYTNGKPDPLIYSVPIT